MQLRSNPQAGPSSAISIFQASENFSQIHTGLQFPFQSLELTKKQVSECSPHSAARWLPASSALLPGSAPAPDGPAHTHRSRPPSGPSSPSSSTARRARRRTPLKEALRRGRRGPGRALGCSTTLVAVAARRIWRCRWWRSGARLQQQCPEPLALQMMGLPGLLRLVLLHSGGHSERRRGN